jgi:hypothetical protein
LELKILNPMLKDVIVMGFSALRITEGVIIAVVAGLILVLIGDVTQNPSIVNNLQHYSVSSNLLLAGIIIAILILITILIIHVRKDRGGFLGLNTNRPQAYVQYVPLGEMKYEDVLWDILQPMRNNIRSSEIIVKSKPRCPQCRTELIEARNWRGYLWKCVRNDFKKTKRHNFAYAAELLVRAARRDYEEGKFL